jgi:lactate 2-monooxygenase
MTEQQSAPGGGHTGDTGFGRLRQAEVFVPGLAGRKPAVSTDMNRLEEAARRVMTAQAFAYVAGGAGRESTVRANLAAFERWSIVPRMLRGIAQRDTTVKLLGRTLHSPFLLAPVGVLEVVHPEAERAVARAAATEKVPMIFSNQASVPMEECAVLLEDTPYWFQLYWSTSDDLVRSFVSRAEICGCEAIVLTVDTTMFGWRTRDLDLGFSPFLRGQGIAQYTSDATFRSSLSESMAASGARPSVNFTLLRSLLQMISRYPGPWSRKLRSGEPRAAVQRFISTYSRPPLAWSDIARLRQWTQLPIVLKGIVHAEDGRLAVEHGVDAIVVSNHGGRQLDGSIAALDALPAVAAVVGGRMPVLFDSGIRGGADVFKALALGATAVCIGRPYAYALALAGERGVREMIRNLRADFDLALGLAGCSSISDVSPDCLVRTGAGG